MSIPAIYKSFSGIDKKIYTDQIGRGISATHSIVGTAVKKLYNEANPNLLRKTAARIIILSVPFFQLFDGCANLAYPIGKLILHKLTKKECFYMSKNERSRHFAWGRASFVGIFLLLPILLHRPSLIVPPNPVATGNSPQKPQIRPLPIITNPKFKVPASYYTDPGFNIDHQTLAKKELSEKTNEELDKDWNLLKYFGNLRFINLERDKEKKEQLIEHLNSIGVPDAEKYRFNAFFGEDLPSHWWKRIDSNFRVDGNLKFLIPILEQKKLDKQHQRQMGCFFSHYAIIKEAKENHEKAIEKHVSLKKQIDEAKKKNMPIGLLQNELEKAKENIRKFSRVLILEDDNRFGRVFDAEKHIYSKEGVGKVFREAMSQLPTEFDMFFLMAFDLNHLRGDYNPVLPKQRIKPLSMGYDLNAYVVHARFYDRILNHLEERYIDPNSQINTVDVEIAKLMIDNKVFRATPDLAFQGGFKSEIILEDKIRPLVQRNNKEWKYFDLEQKPKKRKQKKRTVSDSTLTSASKTKVVRTRIS